MTAYNPRLPPPPAPSRDWSHACALFLDIDGTLLDFAPAPDGAHAPDSLKQDLQRLHDALHGAVALVSGRRVAQIDALFEPLRLPAIGLHGLEMREHDGHKLPHLTVPVEAPPELAAVRTAAQALAAKFPGALVEDKGSALALHWREAPAAEEPLHEFASSVLINLPGYHLQPGNCVFELRPDGAHKGHAVLELLGTPVFFGRRPIVVGDDLTDENAFVEANARDGISILVGQRAPSSARYGLHDPAAARAWLHRMAEDLSVGTAA